MYLRVALLFVLGWFCAPTARQAAAQNIPPVITVPPSNRVAAVGGSVSFTVAATGTAPLAYRWRKDGVPLLLSTNSRTLSMFNLSNESAGAYSVVVTNLYGAVTSPPAMLTVTGAPPRILLNPSNVLICPGGSNITLRVQATGSPPLSYQWLIDGQPIPEQTSTTLVLLNDLSSAGSYSAIVSNAYGSVTSQVTRLDLGPIIIQQPVSRTISAGSNVVFSVAAMSCPPARYQWRQNGVNIPGAISATLLLTNIQHDGDYTVVVSDDFRSVTSAVARLTVIQTPLQITVQPQDHIDILESNIFLFVGYVGTPAPTLQWRKDGMAIPGATNSFLPLLAVPWNQGGYTVVLSNSNGSLTSRVAVVTLRRELPQIIGELRSISYCPEVTYPFVPELYVFAYSRGLVPLYFQWFKDGVPVPEQTNSALYPKDVPSPYGTYHVVVSNFVGSVTSGVATVSYGITFIRQPEDWTGIAGTYPILSAELDACGPYTLQWQHDGVDVPGATNEFIELAPGDPRDAGGYTLIARYGATVVTSRVAQVVFEPFDPVIFDGAPGDITMNAGDEAFLNFSYLIGYPPANIQWHLNGRPIPGATNEFLHLRPMTPDQHGRYFVTLSNVNLVVTSRQARVQVFFSPPLLDLEPEDMILPLSFNNAIFYSYAMGAPPPAYQWYFNGQSISGETNDVLSFLFTSTNQAGGYSVVASNFFGSVTSRVATLTADLYPPSINLHPASQSVTAGEYVYLYAYANGSPAPGLQWYRDGVAIPGANSSELRFQAGYIDQVGGYYLVASNFLGTATSAVAQVNILILPPRIIVHPLAQQLVVGEVLSLYVTISNNIPARFQWFRDGSFLPGKTNQFLLIRTTTMEDEGNYQVVVWNDGGADASRLTRVELRLPESLDLWSWRRPLPQGNHLYDGGYGNGRHVAVGENGAVLISTNGTDWADAHKPGHHPHRDSIVFGNGVFLARDYSYDLLQRSTNGMDWIDTPYPGPVYPGFLFGNGRFVGGGSGSGQDVTVSTNGIDWENVPIEPSALGHFAGYWQVTPLAFVHDRFLASFIPFNPSPGPAGLLYSTNGLDWHLGEIVSSGFWSQARVLDAAYGNGIYLGLIQGNPELLRSTNGVHWTPFALAEPFLLTPNSIAFGNGRFVISGYRSFFPPHHSLMHSTDGVTWTVIGTAGTNSTFKVRFQNDRFVAVGPYGRLITSTNGIDWNSPNLGSDLNLRGITRANGLFVAVGNDGLILTSAEGRNWTQRDPGTNFNFRAVTHFKGRYIAIGEQENVFPTERVTIYTSPDAIHWQPAPSVGLSGRGDLYSLAHNEHTIVAVGNNSTVAVSQDGLNWNDAGGLPVSSDLNAVTWSGTVFYAAGKDGTVVASLDGLSWFSLGPGGGRNLHGIAYGNGILVTVANGGRYFVGKGDGSWSRHDWPSREDLSDILFAGGRFIAIGDNGIMQTSTDGTNWTRRVNPSGNDLRNVIYSEGSYWIVGNNETILQSAQIDPALRIHRINGSTDVALELLGESGIGHRLQGSHNFTDWTDILNFTAGPEPQQHRRPEAAAGGWRFYRVVRP